MNKEAILSNITKQNYVSRKFLKLNSLTEQQCYDICFDVIMCKYCTNTATFKSWRAGYLPTCAERKCKKILRKQRTIATNLARYGVENISQLQSIKDQKLTSSKITNLKKYGVENVFQSKDIMFNNGIHVSKTKEVNSAREQTMLERYNTTDPLSINDGRRRGIAKCNSPEVVRRRKATCKRKYGGDTSFSCSQVQNLIVSNRVVKYGVENVMEIPEIKELHRLACITRDEIRLNDIDSDGLNSFQRVTQNRLNDIDSDGLNSFQRVAQNRLNDIDSDGLNSFQRVAQNRLNDIDSDGLNSYHRAMIKSKETNILNCYWLPDSAKSAFRLYYQEVWKYTNRNDLSVLEHIEKRGHANKGLYHLDHKFSIFQGFKEDIHPSIIGSLKNLEMLIGRNNLSKGRKCSITIGELYEE